MSLDWFAFLVRVIRSEVVNYQSVDIVASVTDVTMSN